MANVIRVYRATVKPGKVEEFKSFLLDYGVPILHKHEGLISVQVGWPRDETPQEFLIVSTWSSIEALAGFAGSDWQKAVVDPREAHLIEETYVHHYYEASI